MAALVHEKEILEEVCLRSYCLLVFAFLTVRLLVPSTRRIFSRILRGAYDRAAQPGLRRESHGKSVCSSRRSTWHNQFGRYALLGEKSSLDSRITRAGNLPLFRHPEEASTRECRRDAAFKYRSNSLPCEFVRPPMRLRVAVSPQEPRRKGPLPRPLNEAHYLAPRRDRSFGNIAR